MDRVGRDTSLRELAALISQALADAGVTATLSGGGAVSFYSENEYESYDLDFVTSRRTADIAAAIAPLGFHRVAGARQFEHPDTKYYIEFPPGPIAFGEQVVSDDHVATLATDFGPVRIVTPTQIIMDRLAAYTHWKDNQSLDQAIMVARRQTVDWAALSQWARREGIDTGVLDRLRKRADGNR